MLHLHLLLLGFSVAILLRMFTLSLSRFAVTAVTATAHHRVDSHMADCGASAESHTRGRHAHKATTHTTAHHATALLLRGSGLGTGWSLGGS